MFGTAARTPLNGVVLRDSPVRLPLPLTLSVRNTIPYSSNKLPLLGSADQERRGGGEEGEGDRGKGREGRRKGRENGRKEERQEGRERVREGSPTHCSGATNPPASAGPVPAGGVGSTDPGGPAGRHQHGSQAWSRPIVSPFRPIPAGQ